MRLVRSLIALLVLCLPLYAQRPLVDTKAIDRTMFATMKAWQIPGAALAVVKNDRVVYLAGYGFQDLVTNEPVSADTLFEIGSVSKAFTSTAMAMLVDEGKMSWDDPVRRHVEYFHLPDLCADANVTLRDLLSHRTGMGTHDELWDGTPLSREQVIRGLGSLEMANPFRSTYAYQNIMFVAAGESVARASGTSWEDFVRARILKPLRMTSTVLTDDELRAADHATGYRYNWKKDSIAPQRRIETENLAAAGAVKTSARDMANWLRFQLANGVFEQTQLVSSDVLNETKTPHTPIRMEGLTRDRHPESNLLAYALGWYVQDYRGEMLISHTGSLNGFRAHIDLLPKRNAGFFVVANVGRSMALLSVRNALADLLTQKPVRDWNAYYLMIERKSNDKDERERNERLSRRKVGTAPSRPLAAYSGTYDSPSHGPVRITTVNDALMLQWNQITVPLQHFHYDVFLAESEHDSLDEEVAFALSPDGEVHTLTMWGQTFTRRP